MARNPRTRIEEGRVDVRLPEWLKKTRDDVPPNDLPLPESPLVLMRRHRPADVHPSQGAGQSE